MQTCYDRVLAPDAQRHATDAAVAERQGNAVDGGRLGDAIAALTVDPVLHRRAAQVLEEFAGGDHVKREALLMFKSKRLATGRTLRVFFVGTWPQWAEDRVMYYLNLWEDAANIQWVKTRDRAASHVRIEKDPGQGGWSYVGTDVLTIPIGEPTMNLGWILDTENDRDEARRLVLHEGGHTLNFTHEQFHPEGTIDWDREAVYRSYGGAPNFWTRSEVDSQVFRKYAGAPVTQFSAYDKWSIMHYPIPRELVTDSADVVGWNTKRSPTDRRYAALWYPYPALEESILGFLDRKAREVEARLGEVA